MANPAEALASTLWGAGPDVVLIHGGMTDGPLSWFAQEQLSNDWGLRVVDRAGYGRSSALSDGEDIELDASLIAEELRVAPAHVVGHSSGAIVAMLVAALVPDKVRSLTVIEPPSYRFLDDPEVQQFADAGVELWDEAELSDRDWLLRFFETYGEDPPPPDIVALLEPHVPTFRGFVRLPWEITLPADSLRAAAIPTLVVSGGHHPAFERLNDAIGHALAGRRAVVTGAGHEVQTVGGPFNDVVSAFWFDTEASTTP
jgi:pimeloyl-ACP methyl ester carboxylesterase